jgi:hypothetical protein
VTAGLEAVAVPLRYHPHPAQRRGHRKAAAARFAAANAGRRGGKTQWGAAEFSRRVDRDRRRKLARSGEWRPAAGKDPRPFLRYCVVAPTYALLDEPKIALQQYLGLVADGGLIIHQGPTEWWLVGGVRIDFRSGDRPERLVSHGYDGVWFEEAARLKASVWTDNMRPTLSDTGGWAIFTTTPLGKNWFWEHIWARGDAKAAAEVATLQGKRVDQVLDPQFVSVSWTTADNTALPHLAEEMRIAQQQLPKALFRRNYLADFDTFEGQLFELDEARHFGRELHEHTLVQTWAGIDIGTRHPTCVTFAGETSSKVRHEVETIGDSNVLFDSDDDWKARDFRPVGESWTVRGYKLLKRHVGSSWTQVPLYFPADAPWCAELFRRRGFRVASAYQEHEPAIAWTQTALHNDKLIVHSPLVWRCMMQLRRPAAGERSPKAWMEAGDDPWDSERYGLSEPIALYDLPTPDRLTAMEGWRGR